MKTIARIMVLMGVGLVANNKQPFSQVEGNKGFAVVELFTSEGCSSCPPADKLIEKIQNENAGKPLYVMAFHVDYWDHQGWKDRFSAPAFTARQRKYADWLRLETIYTPQVVVNGVDELVGSNERNMTKAIVRGLNQKAVNRLSLKANASRIDYAITGKTDDCELVLALVQKKAQTNVAAGENAGRNLSHVQIVRQLIYANIKDGSTTITIPDNKIGYELIGMLQQKKDGHIIAAAKINL
jgi:hypothetical protein